MKIGIMTFWWTEDNYGQLLQCYALQKYLRDLGHDAYLIRYKQKKREDTLSDIVVKSILYPSIAIKRILKILRKNNRKEIPLETLERNKERLFPEFTSKYIKYSDHIYTQYEELQKNPPAADIYIVGSDQIWNFSHPNNTSLNAYFLNFGTSNIKRISYSASFGINKLSYSVKKRVKPLLQRFSHVTVRENTGKVICDQMGIESKVVCDPTLLLSKNQWLDIADNTEIPKGKYVFAYILSNTCKISVQQLKQWAEKKGLGLIYVSGNVTWCDTDLDDQNVEKSYMTINNWITCLANAEYIVTNSFHCCVFSLIFSKKIGVIPLTSELKNTNDRINSLFDNLKVTKTEIIDNNFPILEKLTEQNINTNFIEDSKTSLQSMLM